MPRSAFSRTLEPLETLADWQAALGIDADLITIGGLDKTDGTIIVGNGTTWVAESGATARTSLGIEPPLELVAESQPTSDVASVTFTGLSDYQLIHVFYALQFGSAADVIISGATSGGTHRTVQVAATEAVNDVAMGIVQISNFGVAASHKLIRIDSFRSEVSMDASSATVLDDDGTSRMAYVSFAEIWDELRIAPSTGTIEGSTADERGRITVYGLPK